MLCAQAQRLTLIKRWAEAVKPVVKTNAFIQLLLLCSLWAEVGISSDLGLKSYYSRRNNTLHFIKIKMCLQLLLLHMEQPSWTCELLQIPGFVEWYMRMGNRASCKLNCCFKQALSFGIPRNEAVDIVVHFSLRVHIAALCALSLGRMVWWKRRLKQDNVTCKSALLWFFAFI